MVGSTLGVYSFGRFFVSARANKNIIIIIVPACSGQPLPGKRRFSSPLRNSNLGPCVLKFDSPLPEDHRTNILSSADSPRHHCKLCGGSASILGTSVYRRSKWDRRIVRRPKRAKSDCPTTGDRGAALCACSPHSRQANLSGALA